MKKPLLFLALAATVAFTSCSKDDDDNKCESCSANDTKVEICENGDGTYTLTVGGEESDTIDDLQGLTPKQIADSTCEALKLLPSL